MHSSRDSGGSPDVHRQYLALGADPQDQPEKLTYNHLVPLRCQSKTNCGVRSLPFSSQEGDSGLRRLL